MFDKKGIRKTAFRQKVLDVFCNNENSITIAQIENSIGEHDRITLYRTIKTFIDAGLIHEIVMPGDLKKLALCHDCDHNNNHNHAHQHNHIHFHCEKCNEIICVDNDLPLIELDGYQIDSLEIQAHGICRKCH
jgi:Fur family ferric uptake transcriptional regulator